MKETYILSAVRTAIGSFMGSLKDISAPRLGAAAIREGVVRAGISVDRMDECLMGCVLSGGLGQAPARQAALFAGLPRTVRATTVNRVCGSGLKSVMFADQMIRCGDLEAVVAGGMENMSRAPYVLENVRNGYRLGHGKLLDSMVLDGLWDVYNDFHMGDSAELCARELKFSREEQDRYARLSYERALHAIAAGKFKDEIIPIEIDAPKRQIFDTDEEPGRANLGRFAELRPAFQKQGTVTAANASSIADGAAALVLASGDLVNALGVKPLARIVAQESFAQDPEWFTTAPVGAIRRLLKKANFSIGVVDLFEVNEAFSVVALACLRELGIDEQKANIRGGAVAFGHPLGMSGARILVTLLHALRSEGKRYGVAAICIGGGEASALLVEVFH